MRDSQAVEADVVVPSNRRGRIEVRLVTGRSRSQIREGVYAASVGGQLGDLWPGHNRTDFACLCLNFGRSRLDRNRLLDRAQLHPEVQPNAITDIERDAILLHCFETGRLPFQTVTADGEAWNYITSARVRYGCARPTCFDICRSYRRVGQQRSGWVGDRADNCGLLPEGGQNHAGKQCTNEPTRLRVVSTKWKRNRSRHIALSPPIPPQQ